MSQGPPKLDGARCRGLSDPKDFLDVVDLGEVAALPALAPSVFVYVRIEPQSSEIVESFCQAIRTAALLSFTTLLVALSLSSMIALCGEAAPFNDWPLAAGHRSPPI